MGILEKDFWEMTYAELERYAASRRRVEEAEQKKKASFDYILAELIGRSVARGYNSSNTMPSIAEAYPSLFDKVAEQEAIQEKKNELSAIRFKQFAHSYNKKFKEVGKEE